MFQCALSHNERRFDSVRKLIFLQREVVLKGAVDFTSIKCPADVACSGDGKCNAFHSKCFAWCCKLSTRRCDCWRTFEVNGCLLGNVGEARNGCFTQIPADGVLRNDDCVVCRRADHLMVREVVKLNSRMIFNAS